MSADDGLIFALDMIGLAAWCFGYALLINTRRISRWILRNNKTWLLVVFGIIWVLIALRVLVEFGLFGAFEWGFTVLAFGFGGLPMIIVELIKDGRHRAAYDATEGMEGHGEEN
jgi:hypothetical protein